MHPNFPGQCKHLAPELARQGHEVVALGSNRTPALGGGVRSGPLAELELKLGRGRLVAQALEQLRGGGFVPDVVFVHAGWGEALFIRDVFPAARLLNHAEYDYGEPGGDAARDPEFAQDTLEARQLKLRPSARVVIVGGDQVSYGAVPPAGRTWRQVFLDEVACGRDLSRMHFVGRLPHPLLSRLMQVSAAHVYLTYPFVLSWSLLEAMGIGCLIVGANTTPVAVVIEHGRDGLPTDFFDAEALAHVVADALRQAARKRAVQHYDLGTVCLPRQVAFVAGGAAAQDRPPPAANGRISSPRP